MTDNRVVMSEEWIRSLEAIKAKELVMSIIKMSRVQRKIIRLKMASKRADVLIGTKGAHPVFELQTQTHMKRFISSLNKQKMLFRKFFEGMRKYEEQWAEFIESEKFREHIEYIRDFMKLRMIYTDIQPQEAENLIQRFDDRTNEIAGLISMEMVEDFTFK
ncbi:MAG: hypothetical protein RTV31_16935, partial [Candidatus Thorarchaeota archaeon]